MEGATTTSAAKNATQTATAESTTNPLRILTLSLEGASFYKLLEEKNQNNIKASLVEETTFPRYQSATIAKFTPYSGQQAIIVDELGLHFIDMTTGKERLQIVKPGVSSLEFSPRDTYLVTCEKYQQGEKNLVLWNAQTGKEQNAFEWKKTSKEGSKSIKFTKDEKFMARLQGQRTLEIYDTTNLSAPKYKIVAGEQLLTKKQQDELHSKQGKKPEFKFDGFQFIPQNPDIPAHLSPIYVAVWQHSEGMSLKQEGGNVFIFDLQAAPEKPKFSVQCSRSQEIQVKPSPTGYSILVHSQNFVDSSGKSYYGEHQLQYVQIYGGKQRSQVPIFDGMVHDVAWVPSGNQFIVISGMQPSTATLFDKDCNPLFEFGKRYRNTIRVDPFSNSVLIGGFGNLAGEVDFWQLDSHTEIGKAKAYCSVSVEWAKDGKHVLCAVLHERVKVDNEMKVLRPNGQILCSKQFPELYDAQWQPYAPETFKKPNLNELGLKEENKADMKPKKLFRPPGGGGAFAQIMKMEMGKTHEKGPRKLDQDAYSEVIQQNAINQAEERYTEQPSDSPGGAPWRKSQQQQQPQPPNYSQQDYFQPPQELEVKVSKHAKRRAKKKKMVVESNYQDE